jgi:hypothetical protein
MPDDPTPKPDPLQRPLKAVQSMSTVELLILQLLEKTPQHHFQIRKDEGDSEFVIGWETEHWPSVAARKNTDLERALRDAVALCEAHIAIKARNDAERAARIEEASKNRHPSNRG